MYLLYFHSKRRIHSKIAVSTIPNQCVSAKVQRMFMISKLMPLPLRVIFGPFFLNEVHKRLTI